MSASKQPEPGTPEQPSAKQPEGEKPIRLKDLIPKKEVFGTKAVQCLAAVRPKQNEKPVRQE